MQTSTPANELNDLWLPKFHGVKVLSLDCFDTLFWRKVVEPTDVFFALANTNEFKSLGISADQRAKAESKARRKKWIRHSSNEVTLEDIYREVFPNADAKQITKLTELEIAQEIKHGYIFAPVAALIRQAKRCGLKVIIVSDTYFSENQLKHLITAVMPELASLIDEIYCSSTYGISKAGGIWKKVLPKLGIQPTQLCHLGDNMEADLVGAQRFGIQASHLVHWPQEISDILHQRLQVALQLFPEFRQSIPVPSYFHGQFAQSKALRDSASWVGYASLGPIMFAFANYVVQEKLKLETEGKSVKVAFLLRDGFLPSKACAALSGTPIGHELNISRFTSIAASLDSEEQVLSILETSLGPESMPALLKQFLLPEKIAANILERAIATSNPEQEFIRLILRKETLNQIIESSLAYKARLLKHIQSVTDVANGDTLIFVDLGYSGTAQNRLRRILKNDLNVDLVGRYFIAAEILEGQSDRQGLIDPSWIDRRTINALTAYIAAFEMMCTQNMPSTIDYNIDGAPIYAASEQSKQQHETVEKVQSACLTFVADQRNVDPCHRPVIEPRELARSAAIDLCRLLYFPSPREIECLNSFQFDFNMGTDLKMSLFDVNAGLTAMRRNGVNYMNTALLTMRTNYPVELRHMDISLSTLLFSQHRWGFSIIQTKASLRHEPISILVANEQEHTTQELVATATLDGFFSIYLPLGQQFNTAVLLGKHYLWIEIESIQYVNKKARHEAVDVDYGNDVILDDIFYQDGGLVGLNENGMLYFPAGKSHSDKLCRLVFRPLIKRQPLNS